MSFKYGKCGHCGNRIRLSNEAPYCSYCGKKRGGDLHTYLALVTWNERMPMTNLTVPHVQVCSTESEREKLIKEIKLSPKRYTSVKVTIVEVISEETA